MDPFTIALATFGVQKLRGKSTNRALRDAIGLASLGQVGAMTGVPGLQGFGNIGQASLAGNTIGQQFMQTGPVRGIGALFGKTPTESTSLINEDTFGGGGYSASDLAKANVATSGQAAPTMFDKFNNLSTGAKIGIGATAIPLLGSLFGGEDENLRERSG